MAESNEEFHEDTRALFEGMKLVEENLASCISEEEIEKIFEPISELNLSSSKIYKYFIEKWKHANLAKSINSKELDDLFRKKAEITEDCKLYENTIAWRPTGDVKQDLSVKYRSDKLLYKEKLEKQVKASKIELDNLMDEIRFKTNKLDSMTSGLPELNDRGLGTLHTMSSYELYLI
uniref:Uncharacterized protein n=1 Tax=Cacopsylla melanoneura TaxID=428564 RepID=A0A8D8LV46_9HEMI